MKKKKLLIPEIKKNISPIYSEIDDFSYFQTKLEPGKNNKIII